MGLIRTAIVGAIGYFGYKKYRESQQDKNGVAFASGEPSGTFRNAGADSTASHEPMSRTDEALDETYPASDATAKY